MNDFRKRRRQEGAGTQLSASIRLAAAGMTLAFSVVIGAGFGYWLDGRYKTSWWTPVFALLGVVAGFREMFRAAAAANREDEAELERRRAGPVQERRDNDQVRQTDDDEDQQN